MTSRGIAGKNTIAAAPMDDESILWTFTSIDSGYLGRFVDQSAEDGSLGGKRTFVLSRVSAEYERSEEIDSSYRANVQTNF